MGGTAMPEKAKSVQLGPEDLAKMRHLTHELEELLGKMSHLVLTELGEKAVHCNSVAISLAQSGKPLRIEFVETAGVRDFASSGYGGIYEDPPGV
jgi:hypothetical protein